MTRSAPPESDDDASRGPVDPRLLRLSAPTRRWIILLSVLTVLRTLCTVVTGVLIGTVVADTITGPPGGLSSHRLPLVLLAVLVTAQVFLGWVERRYSHRAAAKAIEDLRIRALEVLAVADPRGVDRKVWRTLLTEGVEGLGPYLTGYLPALVSTAVTVPVTLVVVWWFDTESALIAVITLPLIPVFMWLVGTLTAGRTEKKLADLGVLTDQMLDLVAGLPTLKALGRLDTPVAEVDRLSAEHLRSTFSVLCIAFLSGMVLEFLATLSIALVAVGIGFRLLDGSLTLVAGLTVLIIIPEVYNPVRQVGARFHDARDGFVAVDRILVLLDNAECEKQPATLTGFDVTEDTTRPVRVGFSGLSAETRDGLRPHKVTGTAFAGEITALTGANGAGKTTTLLALLGIVTEGIDGEAVATVDGVICSRESLWKRTSYLPQRPVLDPATVGDVSGRSLGQRQRQALDEELGRLDTLDTSVGLHPERFCGRLLVLDEPTAHLDEENATAMIVRLQDLAASGATIVVASHDPLVIAAADRRIEVQ
ncbi:MULTISPECIES: ABC transporter ATP-binding protein/permease [unclassified Corynebacterium]|uniref:ABC transporter ATP-binding protein/permease n=1 Tax=unclassified Corynebacterium TaxID=2624378 RepID=UPI0040332400